MKWLLGALLAPVCLLAENLTFQWNANQEPDVTGYVLDFSKVPVPTNVTLRSQVANWAFSTNISGRTTTGVTIHIPSATLSGTNWFYLTAVTPVFLSDLSQPVRAVKPAPVTGGVLVGVTIQSTTNLALIEWKDEATVPFEFPLDAAIKAFRAKLSVARADPAPTP